MKLELNRPERLNALSDELAGQLLVLLQEVAEDPSARSVLITGAGRAFCGGADIRQAAADGASRPEVKKILGEVYHPILRTIRQCRTGHLRGQRPGGGRRQLPGARR